MSIKKIKKISIFLTILLLFVVPFVAFSQPNLDNLDKAAGNAGVKSDRFSSVPVAIGTVLDTAISFIGVIFLILTIYGGFLWMTSGGDSEKAKKGAGYIKSGVIGVLIIMLSYVMVRFVFRDVLKADNTSNTQTQQLNSN